MLAWCTILFMLGLLAFSDTIFNYGDIFRKVNSVIFMLISLGLLIRTSMKMRIEKDRESFEPGRRLGKQDNDDDKIPVAKGI